jgi:hypothetical protein
MTRLRVFQPGPVPDPQTFLDAQEIAEPCRVPWAGMAGDDRVRFCAQCRQNVYDVAAMSRDQAVALIQAAEGRVCLRPPAAPTAPSPPPMLDAVAAGAAAAGCLGMLVVLLWAEIAAQAVGSGTLGRLIPAGARPR